MAGVLVVVVVCGCVSGGVVVKMSGPRGMQRLLGSVFRVMNRVVVGSVVGCCRWSWIGGGRDWRGGWLVVGVHGWEP